MKTYKNKLFIIILFSLLLLGCDKEENKYVYKSDENIQYVFYYEDDLVTDFEIMVNFFDNETANNSLEQYKKIYENDSNIEKIYINDKYIVINYKEGYVKQNFKTDQISIIKSMQVSE